MLFIRNLPNKCNTQSGYPCKGSSLKVSSRHNISMAIMTCHMDGSLNRIGWLCYEDSCCCTWSWWLGILSYTDNQPQMVILKTHIITSFRVTIPTLLLGKLCYYLIRVYHYMEVHMLLLYIPVLTHYKQWGSFQLGTINSLADMYKSLKMII